MAHYVCQRGHQWVTSDDAPDFSGCPQCAYEGQEVRRKAAIEAEVIKSAVKEAIAEMIPEIVAALRK